MARKILHTFLAVLICGCPLVCRLAAGSNAECTAAGSGCCHCRAAANHSNSPEKNLPAPVGSHRECSTCVCGGAVVSAAIEVPTDCTSCEFATPALAGVALEGAREGAAFCGQRDSAPGLRFGRALCAWNALWLC